MFGGFYESMRDSKWFNDLYFFDFHTEAWTLVEFPSTALLPCPRSGHQVTPMKRRCFAFTAVRSVIAHFGCTPPVAR